MTDRFSCRVIFVTGSLTWIFIKCSPLVKANLFMSFQQTWNCPKTVYKYTRGGWDHVELGPSGESVTDRTVSASETVKQDYVPHWRWFGMPFNPELLPRIELLGDSLEAPQLGSTRRVHVLLPHDYDTSDKSYPVLYLHDGQNLFGGGAGYGSWEVDQKMAILAARRHHEVILVSIDHGNDERIREFTFHQTRAGKGRGKYYLDFILRTVKPLVDRRFRTLSDAIIPAWRQFVRGLNQYLCGFAAS